ncbi:MAG: glycoside hydrolase family 3 C-terminal domain-containing protein, partial [Bacteroidota bacterium]
VFETFGEDVYLAKQMGVAMVQGYEGDDISDPYRVASCMKHFLGYSMPFAGKDRSPAHMGMIELREYFLPTFQAAVDAGAKTIMINSAEIDGIPVHANPDILTGVLREELGFKGVAVSDWEDIILLVSRHRVAENHKEAIKMAVNAGVDMSMVPLDLRFVQFLTELIEEGEIPMSRIDEAVGRILTLKMELGLFENIVYDFEEYPEFASESHAQAAYEAALASMTLLKNEKNTLPLAKSSKVLLTGPGAHSLVSLNGPWSRTWQGTDPSYDTEGKLTTYQAIQQKIGAENVSYVEGAKWNEAVDIKAAVKAARKVDYVIVCLAEMPATEKPGDIPDLNWPAAQQELLEAMIATKKPVILVLNEARPRIIHPYIPQVKGILQAYQPGHEGGRAIASVLFGDYNPEGKLPYTYHSSANSLIPYDRKTTSDIYIDFSYNGFRPSYPFGFGLSYTTFAYSNLKLDKEELWGNEPMTITVDVKNTGKRAGKEVVQLYVRDHVASVTPSDRRLRGFDKISLEPGEKKTVSFTLYPEELAFIGRDETWTTESGTFTVFIGDKKASFEYKK